MTSKDVSDEQLGQLARRQHDLFRRVREGSVPIEEALDGIQSIATRGLDKPWKNVHVPKMSARELIEHAKIELGIKRIDPALLDWDFMQDEGGETFHALPIHPWCHVYVGDPVLGDPAGNVAAFLAWLVQQKPTYNAITVPPAGADHSIYYLNDLASEEVRPALLLCKRGKTPPYTTLSELRFHKLEK